MFKIGEFARIAQISAKILRHYDSINLFKPAYIDEQNGYRYYTINQLATLNRIIILKELGFSLAQVQELISDELSVDKMQGMFTMHKSQIEQSIEADLRRLEHVRTRLNQIEMEGILHQQVEVVVKTIPAQPILSIRHQVANFQTATTIFHEFATQFVPSLALYHTMPLIALSHTPDDEFSYDDPFELELGLILNATLSVAPDVLIFQGEPLRQRQLPSVQHMANPRRCACNQDHFIGEYQI